MSNVVDVPTDVAATAEAARELHALLYPPETPMIQLPTEEPTDALQNDVNQATFEQEEEEKYEARYKSLMGKFKKATEEAAQLKEQLAARSTLPTEDAPIDENTKRKNEILAKLNEEYPEELIENLRALQRIEAEEVTRQYMQPLEQKAQSVEDVQHATAQQEFIGYLEKKAPNWQNIWTVADELKHGQEPSNDRIAEYLLSPDPSGLYTNYDLVHAYNNEWEADRLAIVCNNFDKQNVVIPPPRNIQREAMVAPSRIRSQPSVNTQDNKKIWTMAEFSQFQVDARNDRYDEATKAALWEDVQKALAEGRIRG